jgi:hypothetical protein
VHKFGHKTDHPGGGIRLDLISDHARHLLQRRETSFWITKQPISALRTVSPQRIPGVYSGEPLDLRPVKRRLGGEGITR